MRRTSRPRALPILIPGALLTLLIGAICLWPPPLAVFLEGKVYDSFLRSAPRRPPTASVTAAALAAGPFVLGYQFDFSAARGETCLLHPLPAAVRSAGGTGGKADLFEAPGVVCNLPVLAKAAGASGFFNVTPDTDGVEAMLLSGTRIPLDRRGNLIVNYRGRRGAFPHVSAAAILDGTADPAALKGKFVILGTTAAGLHEIRTSPLEAAQPGVEIHATVLDNLLAGDPIAHPSWARGLQFALILVPGFLLTAFLSRARALGLAVVVPSIAVIWLGSRCLLADLRVFLSPFLPALNLALVFTLLTSLRFFRADREVRERTRKLALTQDAIIQSLAGLAETRPPRDRRAHPAHQIPGRLMAVADAYDAIISPRLYKPSVPHEEAVRQMSTHRGTHFDPDVLDAFLKAGEEFRQIARRFAET